MLKRLKQVWSAFHATVTPAEQALVNCCLAETEADLFWHMSLPDQRHALNVAATVKKLADSSGQNLEMELLIKAALLHDVGRIKGDMSTFDKSLAVLLQSLCPGWSQKIKQQGRGGKLNNLRHALYIFYHHAELGATKLRALGTEELVIQWVAQHHANGKKNDPPELVLLRRADELN